MWTAVSDEVLRTMLAKPLSITCDLTYPTESHEIGARWPTGVNLIGIGMYALILGLLYVWYRWPVYRQRDLF